eukprot:gene2172-2209_t
MNGAPTLWDFLPFILKGVPVTLEVTFLSMMLAIPVSIILALGRTSHNPLFHWPAGFVIELFRGSSALVQLFWAFYVLPFFGINLPPMMAGVIVLGLNEGSYFSEVVRAGIKAVPAGQREAALTLGFSPAYRFFRIILPQALPIMIPPFGNALVTMLKFTSLVSLVTIQDLSFRANLAATSLGESGAVYGIVIVLYFVLAKMLSMGSRRLELRVNRASGRPATASVRRPVNALTWDWKFTLAIIPDLLTGLQITIFATLLGSLLAFALGLVWALIRLGRIPVLTPAVDFFVDFVRGTPLLIQVYFFFYVFPNWGVSLPALTTGILGIGLFYSASSAEIYRAGIEDLPPGQWEAALTLGLPLRHVWLGIVLPQVGRAILPMLGNQVVAMFKETSVLSTITVVEMLSQAKSIGSFEFRYVEPLTMAGIFYFVISYGAARALRTLEERHAVQG